MIRYLYGHQLADYPNLARTMFLDRADQFVTRLKWDVTVNDAGEERDEYDEEDPLYVIWEQPDGGHGGSLRLLPTTGRTMVNDHFLHLTDGVPIQSPLIWECTRFCLSRDAGAGVAASLMLASGEVMQGFGVEHFVGVFDTRMQRIYRRIGSTPDVLGSEGVGAAKISVGLWAFSPSAQARVARSAGLSPDLSKHWFKRAFGTAEPNLENHAA